MEFLKIIGLCILAAISYGVVHDQVTARICLEYFTVFHPPIFATTSPTLLGLGWGVIATWWMGAILGILLAISTRFGPRPRLGARELIRPIGFLLLAMGSIAFLAGLAGFFWGRGNGGDGFFPSNATQGFFADLWAHTASYAAGFLGGLVVCVLVYRERGKISVRGESG